MVEPLKHSEVEKKDDATLAQEAASQLARTPALQLVAEILLELRGKTFSWWTPDGLRTRYSATERMKWLRERPDVRQLVTTSLTGLVPKAARKKDPEFQAGLLDAAIDDGDVSVKAFEEAFDLKDLVVYGPAGDYWRQFRARMPWNQDVGPHQELVAFVLRELLAERGSLGLMRKPILTPWELRTAIASKVWHTRIPVDVRAAIDDARFERERKSPREAFHAKDDLAIALPEVIAQNVPLKELARVMDVAERAMGFAEGAPEVGAYASMRPSAAERESLAPEPPSVNGSLGSVAPGAAAMAPGRPRPPPPPRAAMHTVPFGANGAVGTGAPPALTQDPSPTPAPMVASHRSDESEVLFEVDIASTDDVAAALDRIEGERPTKA